MKKVNVSYLKNNLSAILAKLKSSGSVIVHDRETPLAILLPINNTTVSQEDDDRLRILEHRGVLRRQFNKLDMKLLQTRPPKLEQMIDVVQLLVADRREGM